MRRREFIKGAAALAAAAPLAACQVPLKNEALINVIGDDPHLVRVVSVVLRDPRRIPWIAMFGKNGARSSVILLDGEQITDVVFADAIHGIVDRVALDSFGKPVVEPDGHYALETLRGRVEIVVS